MVRGGNPFELSRILFSVLRTGKVVAATLDNLDNSDKRVVVQMFGQPVGLTAWAAKIAARMDVPLLPCYFQSRGKQNTVVIGEPIISRVIPLAAVRITNPLAGRRWHRSGSSLIVAIRYHLSSHDRSNGRGLVVQNKDGGVALGEHPVFGRASAPVTGAPGVLEPDVGPVTVIRDSLWRQRDA